MSFVRILVDGYSLLHNWPELAPGRAPYCAEAREQLVNYLTQYHDATGTPITVFFDGSGRHTSACATRSTASVEILYSRQGQTADQLIERTVYRMVPHGMVLVVTDDHAERDTVVNLGGMTASSLHFISMIQQALNDVNHDIKHYNRRETRQFNRPR
jgi:predicted RNA-binding protein with PIN domain